jgi:hypothetical protein
MCRPCRNQLRMLLPCPPWWLRLLRYCLFCCLAALAPWICRTWSLSSHAACLAAAGGIGRHQGASSKPDRPHAASCQPTHKQFTGCHPHIEFAGSYFLPRLHVTLGLLLLHDGSSDPNSHGVCVSLSLSLIPPQMPGTFEARCKQQNLARHHPDTTDRW